MSFYLEDIGGYETRSVEGLTEITDASGQSQGTFPLTPGEAFSWYLCGCGTDLTARRAVAPTDFKCKICRADPAAMLICSCGVVSPVAGAPKCLWCGKKPTAEPHGCREIAGGRSVFTTDPRCPLCRHDTAAPTGLSAAAEAAVAEPVQAIAAGRAVPPPLPVKRSEPRRPVPAAPVQAMEAQKPETLNTAGRGRTSAKGRLLGLFGVALVLTLLVALVYSKTSERKVASPLTPNPAAPSGSAEGRDVAPASFSEQSSEITPLQPSDDWYLRGGQYTGGFSKAAGHPGMPPWVEDLLFDGQRATDEQLAETDLARVPDISLPKVIRSLAYRKVFKQEHLAQIASIDFTADFAAFVEARNDYLRAYLEERGLPVESPDLASRILANLMGKDDELALKVLRKSGFPVNRPDLNEAFIRCHRYSQGIEELAAERVWDRGYAAQERFFIFRSGLSSEKPADKRLSQAFETNIHGVIAAFQGSPYLDDVVFMAVGKNWLPLDDPALEELVRGKAVEPGSDGPWIRYEQRERVSDLLWLLAVDALRKGMNDEAIKDAREIVHSFPNSWYSGHALNLLTAFNMKEPSRWELRVPRDVTYYSADLLADVPPEEEGWKGEFAELAEASRFDLIMFRTDPESDEREFLKAAFLAGQLDIVDRYLRTKKRLAAETWKYLYPTFLLARVNRLLQEEGVMEFDAALVLSLAKTESLFQPDAVSSDKAIGLVQLLPPTYEQVMGERDRIRDPESNLRAGIRYLKHIYKRADLGRLEADERDAFLIAGYHAGEGRAKRWASEARVKTGSRMLDMLLLIESIPISDTKSHILRVLGSRDAYRKAIASQADA